MQGETRFQINYCLGSCSPNPKGQMLDVLIWRQNEASPLKRWLKCDTNISPRRLIIYLLHQMVHHRTTLHGNGQWSATIARTGTKTQTRTWTTKRSSESCAIRIFLRVTLSTGEVGCRMEPLLKVLGNKVWIFVCKKLSKGEYERTQQVQPHPRRGYIRLICIGKSRIRLRFNLQKNDIICGGLFTRKPFRKQFL